MEEKIIEILLRHTETNDPNGRGSVVRFVHSLSYEEVAKDISELIKKY